MAFNENSPEKRKSADVLKRLNRALFWAGVLLLCLGMAAVLLPVFSSLFVGIMIGWLLFLGGIVAVAGAFSFRGTGLFVWQLLGGSLPLLAGGLLIVFPAQGLIALTLLLAIVFVMTGIGQLAFALWTRSARGWGWGLASAVTSIALGAYILIVLPEASSVILGILVGIDFISTGLAMILIARATRSDFIL